MKNEIVSHAPTTSTVEQPIVQRKQSMTQQWPIVIIIAMLGVMLVSASFAAARSDLWWSDAVFWVGLTTLYGTVTLRLLTPNIQREERISLIVFLGASLYMLKLFHSPQQFTFYDELLHWRAVADIQQTGHLFSYNSLLPISSTYPGLHIITASLVEISGLSIFQAGILVIFVARIVMCLALFLLYERLTKSAEIASIATLLYTANPAFLFFTAQFAYESLALPIVALALLAQHQLLADSRQSRVGWYSVLWMSIGSVIVTHHLSTYFLLATLLVWSLYPMLVQTAFALLRVYGGELKMNQAWLLIRLQASDVWNQLTARTMTMRSPGPARTFVIASLLALAWAGFVAKLVFEYLGSYAWSSVLEVFRLLIGEGEARRLFQGFAGDVAPWWEQGAGYAAVLLVLGLLPFGLYQIWTRYRGHRLALALGLLALAYPASQLIRFTDLGLQIAGRSTEFLFLPIVFVLALWLVQPTLPRLPLFTRLPILARLPMQMPRSVIALVLVTVFLGGVVLGWPRWARLPRPYRVAAETRSIEAKSLAAAEWVRTQLPPAQRFAADRINGLLIGAYGDQYVVSLAYDKVNVPRIFFAPQIDVDEREALAKGQIQYIVIDRRLASGVPASGIYFELGEPEASRHVVPIDSSALAKFAQLPYMSRVYDSGAIAIYAVDRGLLP